MEERVYTINVRRGVISSPRWKKSQDSVFFIRNFLKRHMKSEDVKIDNSISRSIWSKGNQNPPAKIRIKAVKDDEGMVTASLFGIISEEELKEVTSKETEKK